ncbi:MULTISPECIES: DUF427 domain-containing protein [Mycolicibacter]|uniref:Nucleotidyltransferase domain-containing protein n=1 Tax=Mycolicibacter virginiensis TaxID=1795032 RepID=A0A9X7IL81_9MYCO|nr:MULTISPECIES: DUF427 domain-containing protein [Mycobacteriaceae]ODU05178.1 MAG: hypothetical protein ABS80_25270 [Pseudonocardia sp. SCN 72-51]UVO13989.1 DUF427 domain-containing protein [Mycobacterium sp. SVM_VP21]OBJ33589.1 hypothetical protein A5631_05605 [Mycolicibacter heraklionensis]PQM51321.1 nucleotidyltransferase domain-containing protein [Mycolicibacter virginiensis]ULP47714.1 DUF427 domain-containing protein [Mycolicibacter virginiensis]
MSLVAGHGPLSTERAGWFAPEITGALVYVEPHPRRVRAIRGERTVIDTESALLVHRQGEPLGYAFPADAVGDLPHRALPEAAGFVQVPWDAVDAWFEEGRRLVHYPPNPYHRVDCRPTRRALRVDVDGVPLVDTDDTVILFETALVPRLYVASDHVRTDLLQASTTSSYCNYKGYARYWSAVVGDTVVPDVAWSYPDPPPESAPIAGLFSFDLSLVGGFAELPSAAGRPRL